ncbi:hypothetical protein CFE70_004735 [Pyrenophora teres f. teres 0-1]
MPPPYQKAYNYFRWDATEYMNLHRPAWTRGIIPLPLSGTGIILPELTITQLPTIQQAPRPRQYLRQYLRQYPRQYLRQHRQYLRQHRQCFHQLHQCLRQYHQCQ